jgi:hypothetical protein
MGYLMIFWRVIMGKIVLNEIQYGDYGKCIQITNGKIEAVVTVDVGPRVIRYGFVGGNNVFCEGASLKLDSNLGEWKIYGGHRLWHSPEGNPRSYSPDNDKVEWTAIENGIKTVQAVEPWVQFKKEMEITMCPDSNNVKVIHRITNCNAWDIEFSAWSLSVMAPGGVEIVPQPDRETGLLGNRLIALWPYSKMNDPRVYWGDKYIALKQNPDMKPAIKFGIPNEYGWAAYINHGNMFIKRYKHIIDAAYPDFGVSYETYTTDYMLEMETLSPLKKVKPGETVEHTEEWELISDVVLDSVSEESIAKVVKQNIK